MPFCRGARRPPGKILTVFKKGNLNLTVPVRFVLPCSAPNKLDFVGMQAAEPEKHMNACWQQHANNRAAAGQHQNKMATRDQAAAGMERSPVLNK